MASWLRYPIDIANSKVPSLTWPPSEKPIITTMISTDVLVIQKGLLNLFASPIIKPSLGPLPKPQEI